MSAPKNGISPAPTNHFCSSGYKYDDEVYNDNEDEENYDNYYWDFFNNYPWEFDDNYRQDFDDDLYLVMKIYFSFANWRSYARNVNWFYTLALDDVVGLKLYEQYSLRTEMIYT